MKSTGNSTAFASREEHERLDLLQLLRGLAVLAVVLFHTDHWQTYFPWPGEPPGSHFAGGFFQFGWVGVDCFFCLSGFVMFWVHGREIGHPDRAGRFVLKRLARIYPPYLGVLAVKICYFLFSKDYASLSWDHLACSFLLFPGPMIVGIAWSLAFEMFFYTLFCGAILFGWTVTRWLVALWVPSILVYQFFHWEHPSDNYVLGYLLNPFHLEFLAGTLAASLARRNFSPAWIYAALALGTSYLIVGISTGYMEISWLLRQKAPLACAFGLILFSLAKIEQIHRVKVPWLLLFLGGASYSIYLIHNLVLVFVMEKGTRLSWTFFSDSPALMQTAWWTIALLALLIGSLYHLVVEKPLLKRCRRRLGI